MEPKEDKLHAVARELKSLEARRESQAAAAHGWPDPDPAGPPAAAKDGRMAITVASVVCGLDEAQKELLSALLLEA